MEAGCVITWNMRWLLVVAALMACSSSETNASPETPPKTPPVEKAPAPKPTTPPQPPAPKPLVSLAEAEALFPMVKRSCADIPCLIEEAYARDPKAKALALQLYKDQGSVAGVGPDEIMDGGYRGKIHLVPELPVDGYRTHLQWVSDSMRQTEEFFAKLFAKQPAPAYRWHGVQFRFVRSVGKHTPSAYAMKWIVEYNVAGSLLTSQAGVFETLFHELFHTNHGERAGDWAGKHLKPDYEAIVKKCGTNMTCLKPFAPNTTIVLATGTYYAFQQNNGSGVGEYAAELAVRYWREQSEMLRTGKMTTKPFKCGPAENARAWKSLVDEFFGGRDLTPSC